MGPHCRVPCLWIHSILGIGIPHHPKFVLVLFEMQPTPYPATIFFVQPVPVLLLTRVSSAVGIAIWATLKMLIFTISWGIPLRCNCWSVAMLVLFDAYANGPCQPTTRQGDSFILVRTFLRRNSCARFSSYYVKSLFLWRSFSFREGNVMWCFASKMMLRRVSDLPELPSRGWRRNDAGLFSKLS